MLLRDGEDGICKKSMLNFNNYTVDSVNNLTSYLKYYSLHEVSLNFP